MTTKAPAEQRSPRLRPPRNEVDPKAIAWWRARIALLFALPVLVPAVLGLVIPPARVWLLSVSVIPLVLGVLSSVTLPRWWFRTHRWEATNTAVYARSGYFWQEWRVAPFSRIQTVDTQRGPLERHYGLATVTVTTASAKGDIKIKGLDHQVAEHLAERLTELTEAVPGDAT